MRDRLCFGILIILLVASAPLRAQSAWDWLGGASHARDYRLRRISSYDRTGTNADARPLDAGGTLTILNEKGPGSISHIWMTVGSPEPWHLKKLVLRMYWDDETEPSVEAPLGDFFGLGNGDYFQYQSLPLSVGASRALNCFFPMPFDRSARITLTNEGTQKVDAVCYNIDMEIFDHPLSPDLLYFCVLPHDRTLQRIEVADCRQSLTFEVRPSAGTALRSFSSISGSRRPPFLLPLHFVSCTGPSF